MVRHLRLCSASETGMENGLRRQAVGRWLTWGASVGFLVTAALHGSGYPSVLKASEEVPGSFGELIPMLWLVFSADLAILGLIIAVVALRPSSIGRPVLTLAALCPLAVAAMQLWSIGFVPPTALLIGVGVLTLASVVMSGTDPPPGLSGPAVRDAREGMPP